MTKWVQGTVVGAKHWTDDLHTLKVSAPEVTFIAGQFGRLALPAPPGSKEEFLGRPYSFVNAPGTQPHEFYFITVPHGPLSARLAGLSVGEPIWMLRAANGFFSVSEVPDADIFWCVSTGTGIGPFLSILRTPEPWDRFQRIVLVHAVRYAVELTYGEVIAEIGKARAGAFTFVPMVSREAHSGALEGRIPAAISDGRLEFRVNAALAAENSHVMLCGNPAMIDDTQTVLLARGMRRHRRREPGHITLETYW